MNLREQAAQGFEAAQALPVIDAAFEKLSAAILADLVKTSPDNWDRIRALHASAQALPALRQAIVSVINDGVAAEEALKHL